MTRKKKKLQGKKISWREICLISPDSPGWDVVADIFSGFLHAGCQVASLRYSAIQLFLTSEVHPWVETQPVFVKQR